MAFLSADRFKLLVTTGNEKPLAGFYLSKLLAGKRLFANCAFGSYRISTLSLT